MRKSNYSKRATGSKRITFVNTNPILGFVKRVERKKRYIQDPNKILRHLFEEVAEVSEELYRLESAIPGDEKGRRREVGKALVDVVFLAVYMTDSVGQDLNTLVPKRIQEVAEQYGVDAREIGVKRKGKCYGE